MGAGRSFWDGQVTVHSPAHHLCGWWATCEAAADLQGEGSEDSLEREGEYK